MTLATTANAWDTVEAGDGFESTNVDPPIGTHTVSISDARSGTSKKGEEYLVVEYSLEGVGTWIDYKQLTKGGQPFAGGIKSAKILLAGFGHHDVTAANLDTALASLVGRRFNVEVFNAEQINPTTGMPYRNTKVLSAVAPQRAPEQIAAPPAQPQWDGGVQDPGSDNPFS